MRCWAARLVLALATAFVAVASALPSRAQNDTALRVGARVESYVDDDRTVVTRPRVSLDARVNASFRLGATYTADAISSASIDVVTRASRRIRETRHDASASLSYLHDGSATTTVGYAFGHEPDYLANAVSVSHARNLDEDRIDYLTLRASFAHGRVGTVIDPLFEQHVFTSGLAAQLAHVMSAASVLRVGVDLSAVNGFQNSAYRTVRLGDWTAYRYDGTDPAAGEWVFVGVTQTARERHPEQRYRGRISAQLLQSLSSRAALDLSFSAYGDSWRVFAGEFAPELRWEPKPSLLFRLGTRVYLQSPAWFFRRRYQDADTTQGFLTDDKELGPLRSYSVHGAFRVPIGDFRIEGRVEVDFYRYPEFTLLPEKRAFVSSLGVVYVR